MIIGFPQDLLKSFYLVDLAFVSLREKSAILLEDL